MLFAALAVGASAAVVIVFGGLVQGRRREVLGEPAGQTAAGPRYTEPENLGSSTSHADIDRPIGWLAQRHGQARPEDSDAAGARNAIAATDRRGAKANHNPNEIDFTPIPLQASSASRTVDSAGKGVLISRLSRFKHTGLDVLVYSRNSADAFPLAAILSEALELAGWNVRIWHTSTAQSVRGLLVQTRRGYDQTVQDPAIKLMLALQEIGLGARGFQSFDSNDTSDDATASAWKQDMIAPIRLIIGSKP